MRKIYLTLMAIAAVVASCQEWEPVFTTKYSEPDDYTVYKMTPDCTIAELIEMYTIGEPCTFDFDFWVAGKVTTSDRLGNFYKSLYIQDETGGIELKVGQTSLYSDYKLGQTLYVNMNGLTLGMYGYKSGNYGGSGMVQIGVEDPSGEYETAYLEVKSLVDTHIYRGTIGEEVEPAVITEKDLPDAFDTAKTCPYLGQLVTIENLTYGDEIFALIYLDSKKDKKSSSNRLFLSDKTWGVNTWAFSKQKYLEYLNSGVWDSAQIGNSGDYNYGTVADEENKKLLTENASAYTVSQYFKCGSKEVIIRTSGYSKFGDAEIDPDVLAGNKTITVTGIMTLYQGAIQIVVNSLDDIVVN